jgi:hypothetical protein
LRLYLNVGGQARFTTLGRASNARISTWYGRSAGSFARTGDSPRLIPHSAFRTPHAAFESRITFVADRPAHDRRYALDCRKITRELGWRPRTRFSLGLARTVRWYLQNDQWITEVTEGRYDFGRLGLSA